MSSKKDININFDKDAIFIFKENGDIQIAIPEHESDDVEAPDHYVKAATLGWIVKNSALFAQLQQKFEREISSEETSDLKN